MLMLRVERWFIFAGIDPVFPLTFLVNSWIPGILDTIFQATFLTALLLYWLCIYHGVRQVSQLLISKLLVVVGKY